LLGEDPDAISFRQDYEFFGTDSRCFIADIIKESWETRQLQTVCLKTSCDAQKKTISIFLSSNLSVNCSFKGQNVTVPKPYQGSLLCPDPEIQCKLNKVV
jgi:hypothetical protein